MRGKYHFREPLLTDDNGLYVTAAQMQFFLNRPKGKVLFKTSHYEFLQYYKNCCLYNLVYDMMEKNDEKYIYFEEYHDYQAMNPGIYFRNNVWNWRPLWNYVCEH